MDLRHSPEREKSNQEYSTRHEFESSLVAAIIEASPDGILVVDDNNMVVSHNESFFKVWKIPKEIATGGVKGNAVGRPDQPILTQAVERVKDPQAFLSRVKELYADPGLDDHCEVLLKDGRTLERHSTVLRGHRGEYLGRVWFFRDLSSHKEAESLLRELASEDHLCGVANRRRFFERADEEFAQAKRYGHDLSIAAMDIDHFKKINDTHGHAVGDQILQAICEACKKVLRGTDLLARIGGEEFAALLSHTDLHGARHVGERLLRASSEKKVRGESGEVGCTVSIGISGMSPADLTVQDTLRRADEALYQAKANGRNRIEVSLTLGGV